MSVSKHLLPALLAVIVATPVMADNVPLDRSIKRIYTYQKYVAIQYDPPFTNGLGCASSSSNSVAAIEWATDPDTKGLLATVLMAKALGKKIGFGIYNCYATVPRIYRIDVEE